MGMAEARSQLHIFGKLPERIHLTLPQGDKIFPFKPIVIKNFAMAINLSVPWLKEHGWDQLLSQDSITPACGWEDKGSGNQKIHSLSFPNKAGIIKLLQHTGLARGHSTMIGSEQAAEGPPPRKRDLRPLPEGKWHETAPPLKEGSGLWNNSSWEKALS